MATEVVMPQMGESIAEGTITKWMKNVGDHVDRDEPLFEISTDKVDAEIPSPAAGTLTEVRFKEGETVEVNVVVAVLDGDGAKAETKSATPGSPQEKAEPPKEQAGPAQEEIAAAAGAEAPATEPPKTEAPTAVERPKPLITNEPAPPAARPTPAAPPASVSHKTEVKTLVKKSEPARASDAPAPHD